MRLQLRTHTNATHHTNRLCGEANSVCDFILMSVMTFHMGCCQCMCVIICYRLDVCVIAQDQRIFSVLRVAEQRNV